MIEPTRSTQVTLPQTGGLDAGLHNITYQVACQITEMCGLLNDGTPTLSDIPPERAVHLTISKEVPGIEGHHFASMGSNQFLHLHNSSVVPEKTPVYMYTLKVHLKSKEQTTHLCKVYGKILN